MPRAAVRPFGVRRLPAPHARAHRVDAPSRLPVPALRERGAARVDRLELGGRVRVVVADGATHHHLAQGAPERGQHLACGRVVVELVGLGRVEPDRLEVAGVVGRPRLRLTSAAASPPPTGSATPPVVKALPWLEALLWSSSLTFEGLAPPSATRPPPAATTRLPRRAVAVDGKTLRGSGHHSAATVHLLAVMDHTSRGVLGQAGVDSKSNEITGFRPLLEGLDLGATVVTADALHTQPEHAD
jgi:hypothetical protein